MWLENSRELEWLWKVISLSLQDMRRVVNDGIIWRSLIQGVTISCKWLDSMQWQHVKLTLTVICFAPECAISFVDEASLPRVVHKPWSYLFTQASWTFAWKIFLCNDSLIFQGHPLNRCVNKDGHLLSCKVMNFQLWRKEGKCIKHTSQDIIISFHNVAWNKREKINKEFLLYLPDTDI